MRIVLTYLTGMVFGLGITVSGMINPAKVVNFFDVLGTWDPSLAFVMAGAVAVTFLGYRLAMRRPAPLLADSFHLPANQRVDRRLLGGAAIFGVGWGIAGCCPGAALPALGTGRIEVFIFVAALIAGIIIARWLLSRSATSAAARHMEKMT